jgi:hypothetical protein
MKSITITLALALLLIITLRADDAPKPAAGPTGRYTLCSAIVNRQPGQPVASIFKIDTATGKTWRYESSIAMMTNGTMIGEARAEGWVTVMDNYFDALDHLGKARLRMESVAP